MFPQRPYGYRGREDIEENIINKICILNQKLVILCNDPHEQNATGKSSIASSVIATDRIQEFFSDGILWLSMSNFEVLNAKTMVSFLEFLFWELHRTICPNLDPIPFHTSLVDAEPFLRQHWESQIYAILSILGSKPKILVVLDNMPEKSVLQPLDSLGVTIMVTIRSSPVTMNDYNVHVGSILDQTNNRSIFDVVEALDRPESTGVDDRTDRQSAFICSLSNLLQSAYKLGFDDHCRLENNNNSNFNDDPQIPGSLVAKLLCNFSLLSKELKEKVLLLSSLPSNVFLPATLIYSIWSISSVQEQSSSMLSKEEDLTHLFRLSMIQMTSRRDFVLIPSEVKRFIDVIFAQAEASQCVNLNDLSQNKKCDGLCGLQEDALEILEHALTSDKDDFIGFLFDDLGGGPLLKCFESVNWTTTDIMKKYSVMFEKEIESSQFSSQNYSSQIETLTSIARVIHTIFTAVIGYNNRTSTLSDRSSVYISVYENITFKFWCREWLMKVVQFSEVLYDLYHENELPPLDFCRTLEYFADVSAVCGRLQESTESRRMIIKIQREYLTDEDIELGKSLINLSCILFLEMVETTSTLENENGEHDAFYSKVQDIEKKCKLALRCFQEYEQSSLVVVLADITSLLLIQILSRHEDQSQSRSEILSTLQDILLNRKRYYGDVYHPRISDIYFKMARVKASARDFGAAVKLMNKSIRIIRQVFGDNHINTSSMLELLASYFQAENQHPKAENLLSKSIGIMQSLCQQDSSHQDNLFETKKLLSNTTHQKEKDEGQPLSSSSCQPSHPPLQNSLPHVSSPSPTQTYQGEFLNDSLVSSTTGNGEKHPIGHTREDAVLLIALADRIFKKDDNYAKAKKYILKALKIINHYSKDDEKQWPDNSINEDNVLKWSAYNKLADICVREDNIQDAAKFYQRALKGFLSIKIDNATPSQREIKAEAVTIAFNLASLVHNSMDFLSAVPLYLKVVDIISQINTVIVDFDNGNTTTSEPTYSKVDHATMLDTIVDLFESNAVQNNDNEIVNDPIAYLNLDRQPQELSAPGNTPNFILRGRTLALTVYVHHLGLDDQRAVYCKGQLDRINPNDAIDDINTEFDDMHGHRVQSDFSANGKHEEKIDVTGKLLMTDLTEQVAEEYHTPSPEYETPVTKSNDGIVGRHHIIENPEVHHPVDVRQVLTTGPDEELDNPVPRNDEEDKMIYVFAVGCCRRNQLHSNSLSGNSKCTYLGTTSSCEKCFLFISKLDGKPFITKQPLPSDYSGVSKGVGCALIGEVYSIPGSLLSLVNDDVCDLKSSLETMSVKPLKDMRGGDTVHIRIADASSLSDNFIANSRNIPRGNYTEFIRARGGIEAFIENSKCGLK
jgi:tetratricopeptide (TPR) repeat protein